jgi:hypothetical protein
MLIYREDTGEDTGDVSGARVAAPAREDRQTKRKCASQNLLVAR